MQALFDVISPVDGQVYTSRTRADGAAVENALAKAQKVQQHWKKTAVEERKALCQKALDYLLAHADDFGKQLSWQMGRPLRYTPFEISKGFKERAEYMMDIATDSLADIQVQGAGEFRRFIRREPLGSVLVLAPWNYPYLTSVNAIFPALLAGNTVLLKHAEQTPLCAEHYAAAFEQAGFPEGVFQYLHLSHPQVGALIQDRRIAYVAFTGSVKGGRAIQQAVSKRFMAAGLELGGKDPAYVRADADLSSSIENLVDGSFFNSGQSCCGIERIYVHESLFKDFLDGFVDLTKKYQLGDPLQKATTLGPMVRTSAAQSVQRQIDAAIAQGAQALIPSKLFPAHQPDSPYMAPQVLIDVNHSMAVMQEETFGPLVGIMSVKDDAEALHYMNDSLYGLTASVWTQDPQAAIRLGDQLETGTCFMNRCDYLDPALAWTGVKNSGRGCTLSKLGYEALTRPKSFHLKLNG
ncbi:MAG: aldehyde dehydrogenase family protein [Bacteroidota bacterium]